MATKNQPARKTTDPAKVTRDEFLAALLPVESIGRHTLALGDVCTIVSTPWPAPDGKVVWPPKAYVPGPAFETELYVNWATVKAVEHKPQKGARAGGTYIEPRASNESFHAQHFLMLDDIGNLEKSCLTLDDPRVKKATYLIETSPDNYQVGFKLATPLDFADCAQLRASCISAGLGDAGSLQSPHRWCRVPGSVNMKPPPKKGFKSVLRSWHPERAFTLAQLGALLGLDLTVPVTRAGSTSKAAMPEDIEKYQDIGFRWMRTLPQGEPGSIIGGRSHNGFFDIVCPWHGEHSVTPDAGYRPGFGDDAPAFKCHHEHGEEFKTHEFSKWLTEQPGFIEFRAQRLGLTGATERPQAARKAGKAPVGSPVGAPEALRDDVSGGFGGNALLDFEAGETPWIVQDTMTYGAHLLVGRPKGGKSWITMDMAYACANGGEFLNKQARKMGVLWIASEDSKATLSRRLKVRGERFDTDPIIFTAESLKEERAKWEADMSFDAWLRQYLEAHPDTGLVIMDTHASCEALWREEVIDEKRYASIVAQAYQLSRLYERIGHDTETCIVLVHHAAKRRGKDITDYHELINLPATVVAGATASLVLADPPDRDIHDEDDHRRVFAMRGRNIIKEVPLLIELKDGHAKSLGVFFEIRQTEAQSEVLTCIEGLLNEQERTSVAEVAAALGKHRKTIEGALSRAAKAAGGTIKWKDYGTLVIKAGRNGGLWWQR